MGWTRHGWDKLNRVGLAQSSSDLCCFGSTGDDGARGIKYLLEKKKEKKSDGYQQPNEGLND